LAGAIVGIIIRYGLDAKKHPYILDCWQNKSNDSDVLPSSVVILYNKTDFYEYTNGKKLPNNFNAQPQFEDKVSVSNFCGFVNEHI